MACVDSCVTGIWIASSSHERGVLEPLRAIDFRRTGSDECFEALHRRIEIHAPGLPGRYRVNPAVLFSTAAADPAVAVDPRLPPCNKGQRGAKSKCFKTVNLAKRKNFSWFASTNLLNSPVSTSWHRSSPRPPPPEILINLKMFSDYIIGR